MEQSRVLYLIASYLRSLKGEEGINAAQTQALDATLAMLETSYGVKETPERFLSDSFYPVELPALLAAGADALKAQSPGNATASVEKNPKFVTFLDVVKGKGYFDGAEPGSLEYLQRQAKLVLKFKEKAATAGPSMMTKEEREKAAEEKKGLGNNAVRRWRWCWCFHAASPWPLPHLSPLLSPVAPSLCVWAGEREGLRGRGAAVHGGAGAVA
jgi:hypothetical protein